MKWSEAKEKTLEEWARIRDHLEEIEPVQLLTDINAMNELCEKAEEEAAGSVGRCGYCLGYQQFGGCGAITADLSLSVADKDWKTVRSLLETFMHRLEALEVPE